jgi:electron transfer flavoprotein alpha subunit
MRGIWVIFEHKNGEAEDFCYGLVSEGRRLAKATGAKLSAVVFGSVPEDLKSSLGKYGADYILWADDPLLSDYHPEIYCDYLSAVISKRKPSMLLLAATATGEDLGVRLAARMRAGFVSRCVDLVVTEGAWLEAVKPVQDGNLYAHYRGKLSSFSVITFQLSALDMKPLDTWVTPEVKKIGIKATSEAARMVITGRIKADYRTVDLVEAEKIVAGGRGVEDKEGFKLIEGLADAVEASVAGSRPLVDLGVIPFERQIGQTGKTVSPELFVTCGISGAQEFTAGMDKSKVIIAVNKDSRARIFGYADFGIIGDLREVVPEIIEGLGKVKKQSEK